MLRKLTVLLIAALFSVSVAGLSYAQEKPKDKPIEKSVEKPKDPCAQTTTKKPTKKETKAQKQAKQKAACLEKAPTEKDKADCEKKFAAKAKKGEKGTTMAPESATKKKAEEKGAAPATTATTLPPKK